MTILQLTKTPELHESIAFMKRKHAGQTRVGGGAYAMHPLAVANIVLESGYGLDHLKVALFHDLLEDTDATEAEILSLSNQWVLQAVKQLTKTGLPTGQYLGNMGELARTIKLADRINNLSSSLLHTRAFRLKYIKETRDYYLRFASGHQLETHLLRALAMVEKSVQ